MNISRVFHCINIHIQKMFKFLNELKIFPHLLIVKNTFVFLRNTVDISIYDRIVYGKRFFISVRGLSRCW